MKKRILVITSVVIATIWTSIGVKNVNKDKEATMSLIFANVEALASSTEGGLDCKYVRHPSTCTIYVGAKGKIKLLGGTILEAGADGHITFDGQVSCSGGGDFACTPVECNELYQTIF